jgi:hypothetical protein
MGIFGKMPALQEDDAYSSPSPPGRLVFPERMREVSILKRLWRWFRGSEGEEFDAW